MGDEARQGPFIVFEQSGADGEPRADMRQIRSFAGLRRRAVDAVAISTVFPFEQRPSVEIGVNSGRRAAAHLEPGIEVARFRGGDREGHKRMRCSAKLGALAAIGAGFRRTERQAVGAARDHVHLAAEGGNPERVNHVGAGEHELDPLADREAYFVCRNHGILAGPLIHDPPPELAGHDFDAKVRVFTAGERSQRRHQPKRVGQECRQHRYRQDDAAPENDPSCGCLGNQLPLPARGIEREQNHEGPDHQTTDRHRPEQSRNLSRLVTGGVERGLDAIT